MLVSSPNMLKENFYANQHQRLANVKSMECLKEWQGSTTCLKKTTTKMSGKTGVVCYLTSHKFILIIRSDDGNKEPFVCDKENV